MNSEPSNDVANDKEFNDQESVTARNNIIDENDEKWSRYMDYKTTRLTQIINNSTYTTTPKSQHKQAM